MVKGWRLPQWLGVSTPTVGRANALVCDALGFGYQAEPLHSPLNVRFKQGLVHGVLGENGSGKSCLIKTLAGLVQPLAGRVELSCSDAGVLLSAEQRHEVVLARRHGWQGYLEQQAQVHWNLSVYEVVALGASARRDWSPAARTAAVEEALVACDCQALASRPVLQLSTGERQRVMLARVLAAKPQVLLVDEPTAGLDPRHQHGIMQLLRAQASAGAIVIAVMHDIALTRRYCDTALLLSGCKDRSRCLNLSFAGCKDRSRCLNLSSVHGEQCKNQAPGANLAFGPVAEVLTDAAVRRVFGIG